MKIDDKLLPVEAADDKARRRSCGPSRALTNYKTAGGIKIIIRAPTRDNKQKLRTSWKASENFSVGGRELQTINTHNTAKVDIEYCVWFNFMTINADATVSIFIIMI